MPPLVCASALCAPVARVGADGSAAGFFRGPNLDSSTSASCTFDFTFATRVSTSAFFSRRLACLASISIFSPFFRAPIARFGSTSLLIDSALSLFFCFLAAAALFASTASPLPFVASPRFWRTSDRSFSAARGLRTGRCASAAAPASFAAAARSGSAFLLSSSFARCPAAVSAAFLCAAPAAVLAPCASASSPPFLLTCSLFAARDFSAPSRAPWAFVAAPFCEAADPAALLLSFAKSSGDFFEEANLALAVAALSFAPANFAREASACPEAALRFFAAAVRPVSAAP